MRDKVVKSPGVFRPAQPPSFHRRRMQQHQDFKGIEVMCNERLAAAVKHRQPPLLDLGHVDAFNIGEPYDNVSGLDERARHGFAAFKNGVGSSRLGGLPPALVHS